jgi:fructose-bisphosphate aldolase class 1
MSTATGNDLERTAIALVAERRGILAADETSPTLTKRFLALGIESTSTGVLFRTPRSRRGMGETRT